MKYLPRIINITDESQALRELKEIGVHSDGISIMKPKGVFRAVKVKGIKPVAANIIKQEMLARGGEVAVSHGAINQSVKTTDLIIFGTLKQFCELLPKLEKHQFDLPALASEITNSLDVHERDPLPIKIGKRKFVFGKRTYLMGILNVTPDSFSDGGKFFSVDAAVKRAIQMEREGADIIDVGGESTRPGAKSVGVAEELRRVIPVIKRLRRNLKIPVSIDTTKSIVARRALEAGAKIINDISGLNFDKKIAEVAADFDVPVVLMHIKGRPRTMQRNPRYKDLMVEILEYFAKGIKIAESAGVKREKLIVDPGIGFGKTLENNLEILRRLSELKCLGMPILVGTSRKSVIGRILGLPPGERAEGTAATVAAAIINGADVVRVHDVKSLKRVAKMTDAVVR
jgi:dihydropteroate synthase